MSSLTDTTDTVTIDTTVPTDEAGQPLIWDGNPARVLGLLHESSEYFERMGQHQPAITMRAALLSNGRLAVESVSVVPFILGTLTEPDRSLLDIAPPPTERIAEYNAARTAAGLAPRRTWMSALGLVVGTSQEAEQTLKKTSADP